MYLGNCTGEPPLPTSLRSLWLEAPMTLPLEGSQAEPGQHSATCSSVSASVRSIECRTDLGPDSDPRSAMPHGSLAELGNRGFRRTSDYLLPQVQLKLTSDLIRQAMASCTYEWVLPDDREISNLAQEAMASRDMNMLPPTQRERPPVSDLLVLPQGNLSMEVDLMVVRHPMGPLNLPAVYKAFTLKLLCELIRKAPGDHREVRL